MVRGFFVLFYFEIQLLFYKSQSLKWKKTIYPECCRPWETEEHLLLVGNKGWGVCLVPASFCVETRPLVYHLGLSPAPHSPLSRSPNDLSNPWSLGTETRDREPVTLLVPSYPLDSHISVFSNILAIWEQASMWGSLNHPAPPVSSQARLTIVEFSTRKPAVDAYLSYSPILVLSVKKNVAIWIPDVFFHPFLSDPVQNSDRQENRGVIYCPLILIIPKMSFSSSRVEFDIFLSWKMLFCF